MDDLIRRSAARLLAISLAMATDVGDAHEDITASGDESANVSDPSALPIDQESLELEQQ